MCEKSSKNFKHDFRYVAGLRVSNVLHFPRTRVFAVEVGISMLCVDFLCLTQIFCVVWGTDRINLGFSPISLLGKFFCTDEYGVIEWIALGCLWWSRLLLHLVVIVSWWISAKVLLSKTQNLFPFGLLFSRLHIFLIFLREFSSLERNKVSNYILLYMTLAGG